MKEISVSELQFIRDLLYELIATESVEFHGEVCEQALEIVEAILDNEIV